MRTLTSKWVGIGAVLMAAAWLGCPGAAVGEEETGGSQKGKIEAGKPQYLPKNAEAWKSKGRIVGVAKQAPAFKVKIRAAAERGEGRTIEVEKLKDGGKAYEVWLEPGVYSMVVSAPGYEPLELKDLEVRKGNDLRIDLEFTNGVK